MPFKFWDFVRFMFFVCNKHMYKNNGLDEILDAVKIEIELENQKAQQLSNEAMEIIKNIQKKTSDEI